MTTAALQLFVQLDGEALHVALLMPDKIRERWKELVTGLLEYYNAPGRLAVFHRQFENACRHPGVDPATFATELGILAVSGFADMNGKARDLMIRNKLSLLNGVANCVDIWMGPRRRLQLETLWIVAEFWKATGSGWQ